MILLQLFIYIIILIFEVKILTSKNVEIAMPFEKESKIGFSGLEGLLIFIYATVWFGFDNFLAIQLGIFIIIIILGLAKCENRQPFSFPLFIYVLFILWTLYGLTYTRVPSYGIRMILKYSFPFLFALLCAKIVRRGDVFLYAGSWARIVASIGITLLLIKFIYPIAKYFFWYDAAFITAIITYVIFSFALADFSNKSKLNFWWGVFLCLPCVIAVFRTDIYGTALAIACFFIIKYKLKSVPIIAIIAILGLCVIFLVPSVKNKMFLNPEQVNMEEFVTGDYDQNNIQMNFRQFMWDHAKEDFYYGHEWKGSGTGRVQTQYELELTDVRKGGLPHNDFLIIMCDNGNIGLILFISSYILIFLHCIQIYHQYKEYNYLRVMAMVAGSALLGVAITMYTDNTVSYSMITLSQPWGFYGMMLGLKHKIDYNY